jgi:hypothetical protein
MKNELKAGEALSRKEDHVGGRIIATSKNELDA